MPPSPHRPSALAWQVFRGSDAIRRGLVTEHQLRSSAWTRLRHDVYADARLDRDHALACRAATLRLPPEAVAAGPSAAYLHGVAHAAAFTDDVHVLLPRTIRVSPQRGLRAHSVGPPTTPPSAPAPVADLSRDRPHASARPTDDAMTATLRTAGPPPRTAPAAAAWETAVWLEPLRAVGIVDALLGQGLTSRDELAETADRNADRPGGRRARWVFDLADPDAGSPAESQLRVRLVLAGLPRPVARHPVVLAPGLVLRPDLAWPRYRVAVRYAGRRHVDADHPQLDHPQLDQLAAAGWLVLSATSRRLRQEFPALLVEVRAALAARGWRN
ncbi:hypothetical protein ACSNOB_06345 [Micromonospora sp. URMC 106]|uniref:hypothetical protein n=1 Tax=Micromonospora sp. URMC 106 TaxID=3423408 RepID=UPI003F1AFF9D